MITVHVLAYNESKLIQFFIDHYRSRFKNCEIVVFDNQSTDDTKEIALRNSCKVIEYDTNNQINDMMYLQIKNNCWKQASTDWVLVCDIDELLDINEKQLKKEQEAYVTVIKPEAYHMVNLADDFCLDKIDLGIRDGRYDKCLLFNKKFINEINYLPGAHECRPIGRVKFQKRPYKLLHYKYINQEYIIDRYKMYTSRLSDVNIKYNMGSYYRNEEQSIREDFSEQRKKAVKII